MAIYYIKGVKGRGSEVIRLLESKGGNAHGALTGESEGSVYYITKNGDITFDLASRAEEVLKNIGEELHLPYIIDSDGNEVDSETLEACCYFARLSERRKVAKIAMEVYKDLLDANEYDAESASRELARMERALEARPKGATVKKDEEI